MENNPGESISFENVKSKWNEILDQLLAENRVAWLAYFDARIIKVEENRIHLSFIDVEKLGNPHDYAPARSENLQRALKKAISEILMCEFEVVEN